MMFLGLVFAPNIQARVIKLVTLEYPPYEFQGAQDASGIAVELVREAFKRIDQPFSIQFLPWGRAIREIKNGRVDGIFTIYKTPEREAFMDYSDEVLIEQSITIFTLHSNQINFDGQLASLAPYSIGVVRKVSYGEEIDRAIQGGMLRKLVTTDTGLNSFKLLLAGRVDVVFSNQLGGLEIVKQLGVEDKVHQLQSYTFDIPSFIAFSKNRGLKEVKNKLDIALRDMKEDGVYHKIVNRYLKRYKETKLQLLKVPQSSSVMVESSHRASKMAHIGGVNE